MGKIDCHTSHPFSCENTQGSGANSGCSYSLLSTWNWFLFTRGLCSQCFNSWVNVLVSSQQLNSLFVFTVHEGYRKRKNTFLLSCSTYSPFNSQIVNHFFKKKFKITTIKKISRLTQIWRVSICIFLFSFLCQSQKNSIKKTRTCHSINVTGICNWNSWNAVHKQQTSLDLILYSLLFILQSYQMILIELLME